MRYYSFHIHANRETIKANAKISLREFGYDNEICSVNSFVKKNSPNYMAFFIFREENEICSAALSFDEKKHCIPDLYEQIVEMLREHIGIKPCNEEPSEITMFQFQDMLQEAKRHEYLAGMGSRIAETCRVWAYFCNEVEDRSLTFEVEERIAAEKTVVPDICDKDFIRELKNIEDHKLDTASDMNMAHYTISGNSLLAEFQLAELLVGTLYQANRLTSRRIVYISAIHPNHLERNFQLFDTIIENNYGGTVVFDLSERIGCEASQYQSVSERILDLFRRHGNKCLFIFTYNRNKTGYSFYILPEVRQSVLLLTLKEGKGDRKAATSYLRFLAKRSPYAKYAKDAGAFMKELRGKEFTQTDILKAAENFGLWCINRSMNGIYNYRVGEDFMLDRTDDTETSMVKLQQLIGLNIVKKQIENVIAADLVEKERRIRCEKSGQHISSHMIFAGNPGTAKTTVAKLFAGIAKEKAILKSGVFIERGGMDMNMVCNVREAFVAAKGGVLFIDEAYAMWVPEAISALIQEMENHRDSVIVILAGYSERMRAFLQSNEGLKSRVPNWIEFPDYSTSELTDIFKSMLKQRGLRATEEAVSEAERIFDQTRLIEDFGNGRFARNILERALLNQSARLMLSYEEPDRIPEEELYIITQEDISSLHEGQKAAREPGEAMAEFQAMIGLDSVKEVLSKAIAKFKIDKVRADRGILPTRSAMHMVFTGNPGTAKTTVARLCAEILNDEKILPTGNFIEAGRADLVGDHVGATAKLVKRKFREAQGGVLFIDEAYALCDGYKESFGDEAINTIVQEMENHREDTIVIFAGYPQPMMEFLERNPGMKSRIAFQVGFQDYSTDELCEIAKLMLSKKRLTITESAMEKLRRNFDTARKNDDYGNGRYVRKLLEEAEMNLAIRLSDSEEELTQEKLTTIEECDIPDFKPNGNPGYRIGFAC